MFKTVTFKCTSCGKNHVFEIGAHNMSTVQDAVDHVPERDASKLLEAVNRMLMNKTEAQRYLFTINNANSLSMINYDSCATAINLFDVNDVRNIYSRYTPEQIEKLNHSMLLWDEAVKSEGFIAFEGIFYCRKCKKLMSGIFLKVSSVEDKKERIYLYTQKCPTCGGDTTLVNDGNMGYMFEGLTARAPCPDCGGKIVATEVKFKP